MMPNNNNSGDSPKAPATIAFTVGEGRKNPQGFYYKIKDENPGVKAVAEALRTQPATLERWWSMHLWKKNKRSGQAWIASSGVVVDIDYYKPDEFPSADLPERLKQAAATNELPGSIFHLTPHGARLVWVYGAPNSDRTLQEKAERGAATLVTRALEKLGLTVYEVDASVTGDLARFLYTPNSEAKGVKRSAQIYVMNETLSKPTELALFDVAVRPVEEPKKPSGVVPISTDLQKAIDNWNSRNAQTWPKNSAECPICGDSASFGSLPEAPERWYCFSSDHKAVGVRGDKGFHGDALDLEAFKRGMKTIEVLRVDGYLKKREREIDRSGDREAEGEGGGEGEENTSEEKPLGMWRSRSYLTAVGIIKQSHLGLIGDRNVLEKRKLEFNEMSGDVELGRQPIKDTDASRIRFYIERDFSGGVDKNGNQVGLQLSSTDVRAAIDQVASEHPYHPVRDYLQSLTWDGTPRICTVAKLLGAKDSEITQITLKRFFISAVARAREPGCQVDTVLILVGRQGARKSSFFRALSDPWFIDTPIDLNGDKVRAYMTMRKAWLMEWAELEAMLKAKRGETIKAFLTSRSDSYIPKYGHYTLDIKRTGIVVGTTNQDEFLEDATGHRRFWPITIGDIDLDAIAAMRDQLWAEAQALYDAGERWWLSEDEERMLGAGRSDHEVSDSWAETILDYVAGKASVSVQDVLGKALCIEKAHWTGREVSRVTRVLKTSGEWKPDPNKVKGKPRLWVSTRATVPQPPPASKTDSGADKGQAFPAVPQAPTLPGVKV